MMNSLYAFALPLTMVWRYLDILCYFLIETRNIKSAPQGSPKRSAQLTLDSLSGRRKVQSFNKETVLSLVLIECGVPWKALFYGAGYPH